MRMRSERGLLVGYGRRMIEARLTTGTGGNLSIFHRRRQLIAVTPSGVEYDRMRIADVALVDAEGRQVEGDMAPTSELALHLALYRHRPDATAVVHTHSVFATTLACLGWEIPAVHYLVGLAGRRVPVAPYATYGTPELARNVVAAMTDTDAVLMANHGLVAVGRDLGRAFAVAEELELVARIYYQARTVGRPVILPDDEMERVMAKFAAYGQPAAAASES